MSSFSERNGFERPDVEITVRNEASQELRDAVIRLAYKANLKPSSVRAIMCEVLLKAPDRGNWSEFPNIDSEVHQLIEGCEWFDVYDAIEEIFAVLKRAGRSAADGSLCDAFADQINRFFRKKGIGWQLIDGRIEMRGSEAFEHAVREGRDLLWQQGKKTAATELHEAIQDLSRRPVPEVTGAIQHGIAALECVARDVCGSKDTLGDLIQRNAGLFPKPVDTMVEKAWGWTSNYGRHLQEGNSPSFEEAEMMVGISGVLCRYLVRKIAPLGMQS